MKWKLILGILAIGAGGALVASAAPSVNNYFQGTTAGSKDNVLVINGTWKVDDTSVLATGARLNHELGVHGTTISTATDLTRAEMIASKIFNVTPKGGTDVDLSDDTDFVAADFGMEFIFVITSAGDSAQGLTVTDGASGVVVKRVNAVGTSCEDVTDHITCTVVAAELVMCSAFCAD